MRTGLLEQEIKLLQESGYTVLKQSQDDGDLWQLTVTAPPDKTGAGALTLEITLPHSYPLMPPRILTRDLSMGHHQHPFTGDLCLIERSTENWIPEWHLAGLLDNQLRRAIAAGHAAAGEGIDEFDQGEPFSAYYTYASAAGFLLDSAQATPAVGSSGDFDASFVKNHRFIVVLNRMRQDGNTIYDVPEDLHAVFEPYAPAAISGRWIVLDRPPATNDPREIWRTTQRAFEAAERRQVPLMRRPVEGLEFFAVGFPEEHSRGVQGIGWILVVKADGGYARGKGRPRQGNRVQKEPTAYMLLRSHRAGQTDLAYRAPETHGLEKRSVAVIGCGAIGSVIVEQLARAGVGTFHLLDSDTLEPGNLARHAGTLDMIGVDKSAAMALKVKQINPYADVFPQNFCVGMPQLIGTQTETEVLGDLFRSVNLVIDASAEIGVQQYTSLLAREQGTHWMAADATRGIAGGTVVKIDGDADTCFGCFQWHQHTGSIPEPPTQETALVQPVGCAAPTFTGTGFDVSVVALQAVRVATGVLSRGNDDGYPEDGFDAHILSLRNAAGRPCPPAWQGFTLEQHIKCGNH